VLDHPSAAPSLEWTLRDYFESHYVPEILARREVAKASIERYWPLLDRFEEFAGENFPLAEIDTKLVAKFREWLLARKIPGGLSGKLKTMSPGTVVGEMTRLRAMLRSLGPSRETGDGFLNLLPRVPYVKCRRDQEHQKGLVELRLAPSVDDFQRWFRAIDKWPVLSEQRALRALLAIGFYTGYRITAILSLQWRHIVKLPDPDGFWIDATQIPQSNRKRAIELPVHPRLMELLQATRWGREDSITPDTPIITLGPSRKGGACKVTRYRGLNVFHALQKLAGDTKLRPVKDWRAGHTRAIGEQGFRNAMQMASDSVGHSSVAVTSNHYWNAEHMAVLLLPRLE
jgi:integrase